MQRAHDMDETGWRAIAERVDVERVGRVRRARSRRLFREVVEAEGREEHQRIVPLPLTIAAILLPFLAAWATAAPGDVPEGSKALPEAQPPAVLARETRAPEDPHGYVDLWAAPNEWEARVFERHRSAAR